MTIRRFNYTNLQRIYQKDILVSIASDRPPTVLVSAALENYALPADAPVVLEAYADKTESRHHIGSVRSMQSANPITLDEFDSFDGVRFRLKVLGTKEHAGLILAEADRIAPVEEEKRSGGESFVRVTSGDTGGEVWRLRFDSAGPLLMISSEFSDWKSLIRTDVIRGLILPAILRQLLDEAISRGEQDDETDWTANALRLGRSLSQAEPPVADDQEALEDWLDGACSAFAKRMNAIDLLHPLFAAEDQ